MRRLLVHAAIAACLGASASGCGPSTAPASSTQRERAAWLAIEHVSEAREEGVGKFPPIVAPIELMGVMRNRLFQHPPSRLVFPPIVLRAGDHVALGYGIDDISWGPEAYGDGVTFRVALRFEDGTERLLLDRHMTPRTDASHRGWHDLWVDVSSDAGRTAHLVLETTRGPEGSTGYEDFSSWADPRIVRLAAPESPRPANLLLVSFDTLRADVVSAYGGRPGTSPTIDALAARGARFARATATAPWTAPSHYSMLAGLYPDRRQITYDGNSCEIAPEEWMLAERLDAAGYHTGAITGGGFAGTELGFAQGFHSFETYGRRFESNLAAIETWIDRHSGGPFFLLLHHFNMHRDYSPPAEVLARFVPDVPDACRGVVWSNDDVDSGRVDACLADPRGLEYLRGAYAAELAYADELLGRVLERLRDRGVLDGTLVVVTSDHGEELYEHGSFDHVRTVYREVLEIPLVVAGPRVTPGRVVHDVADLTDVVPTLLDLLGLDAAIGPQLDGVSHAPALTRPRFWPWRSEPARRIAFAATRLALELPEFEGEQVEFRAAAISRAAKLIEERRAGTLTRATYDITSDAGEHSPLDAAASEYARDLGPALDDWLARLESAQHCRPGAIGDDVRRQLRALGYGK